MQRKTNIDPKKKAFRDLMLDALDNEILSQKPLGEGLSFDSLEPHFCQNPCTCLFFGQNGPAGHM